MSDQPLHTFRLHRSHQSGAEEWICPACGRRVLINRPPSYQCVVLAAGDTTAVHVGGSPSRTTVAPFQRNGQKRPTAAPDEPGDVAITDTLLPWIRWMEQAGL
ncbi:MAG: hypothetical protein HXY39_06390 [Chloroflexi bacterium]|nr:hypothetical protein [Chloroflexota bacterium]